MCLSTLRIHLEASKGANIVAEAERGNSYVRKRFAILSRGYRGAGWPTMLEHGSIRQRRLGESSRMLEVFLWSPDNAKRRSFVVTTWSLGGALALRIKRAVPTKACVSKSRWCFIFAENRAPPRFGGGPVPAVPRTLSKNLGSVWVSLGPFDGASFDAPKLPAPDD